MQITRSELARLVEPTAFQWLAGIEDTFITAPWPKTGRTLDEYELTQHYERWREDIGLFAELGVRSVRYGIPWHRINPAPGTWDFDFADRSLDYLLELGIHPVVDLVHYGVPAWMEQAYLAPDFADRMAEYAGRVAQRYRGRIHTYTPLNEPGWWPPFQRGWSGFVRVMLGLCRGIVHAAQALRSVDSDIVPVHVDATDLYLAGSEDLQGEAQLRQEIVFLALDLLAGRIGPGHTLYHWLRTHGADEGELAWFRDHAVELDLVGINLYPMFSEKRLVRSPGGLRIRMRYASADIIDRLADLYWQRYKRPLFISETASDGSVARRRAWLEDSVAATARVRGRGVPLVGYTWWPLFALVTWAYRQGRKAPHDYLKQMGLWDLRPGPYGLERAPTELVARYRELVAAGGGAVGHLAMHPQ